MAHSKAQWDDFLANGNDGLTALEIVDQEFIDLINASFSKVSREDYEALQKNFKNWTLIHCDYHPGNTLVRANPETGELD